MTGWKRLMAALFVAGIGLTSTNALASLKTDKKTYALGETVRFILTNTSNEKWMWSSIGLYPVVWRILPDGGEEVVREEPLIVLLAIGTLEPGKSRTWTWDQRDYHQWYDRQNPPLAGKQVPAGTYVGRFGVVPEKAVPVVKGLEFETPLLRIGNALAVSPRGKAATTWARLKFAQ